ncbi:MAG: hypothetical protein OXL96_11790 [Candidatus Poribacteria bacterium]|nr:hypothetical protein [Candidatus Poribacteria bacterium]
MAKLRSLRITAFRGARFDLTLDFRKKNRSLAIFGENAAGKSTITDALEWFIHDRVGHLWREDCKQEALRHVLANENDDCRVGVCFDGKDQKGSKRLSAKLKTTSHIANDNTRKLIGALKDDGIILRHADIVKFLDESKGNKRTAIAEIIGYEKITQFRTVIQQTRNALQREGKYTGAKQQSESLQSAMIEAVGQVVPDMATFLGIAQDIVKPFGLKTAISDEGSYAKALDELRSPGSSAEKIRAANRFFQLSKTCDDLITGIDAFVDKAKPFRHTYNALTKERESVNRLRLSDFLTKGKNVIDDESYTEESCPFCLSPYDLGKLQVEVQQRLAEMAELQTKFDKAKDLKDTLITTVRTIDTQSKAISDTYKDLEKYKELLSSATAANNLLPEYFKGIETAFNALEVFDAPEGFDAAVASLRGKAKASSKQAQEDAKKLGLTVLEKQVTAALGKLQILGAQMRDYEKTQRTIDTYEKQILTLSTIFDRFIAVQNKALQAVLDTISADVGTFYSKLHPNESVDKVRLTMVGEEGVEFQYSFHGQPTQPPRKYLSESHLNSLGVVLFLANARIFNKHSRFLVLDDIVTSFDTSHRRRLLRLLRDEFSDWQIIILTHENIWFDLIKKEMAQCGWLFHEVRLDDTNGILMDESPAILKAITEKKKGKEDVTNDLRKLLESVLKEICCALEVKVSFRFNDMNEKRMSDELLARLRSSLKEKSPNLEKNSIFPDLAGSALIANLDSHDNPDKIVGEDADVLLEDIEKLISLFYCAECHRPIQARARVPRTKEISCNCGKSTIPWKF